MSKEAENLKHSSGNHVISLTTVLYVCKALNVLDGLTPKDEGITTILNNGNYSPYDTVSQPTRLES
jgi:hypothetical protein